MPARGKGYTVQSSWFLKTDSLGHQISTWCKKLNENDIVCMVCDKTISCQCKGLDALKQHVNTSLHQENAKLKLQASQLRLGLVGQRVNNNISVPNEVAIPGPSNTLGAVQTLQLYNVANASICAELIWAMKNIVSCMSARSCDGLPEVFQAMFPTAVPGNFSIGRTKMGYLTTEALGPYFKSKLLDDVQNSFFSVLYDETTNNESKKELQISLRFWSRQTDEVCVRHLETVFMGHATAKDLVKNITTTLSNANLSRRSLLMLGSDGPNVNKAVLKIIDEDVRLDRGKGLVNIGTCNIHTVHNAFLKGLGELGECASDLIIDVYSFFNDFPSRWEDFEAIQKQELVPQQRFIKHVSSRWLTIDGAAKRVLTQWPALMKYFFTFIPTKKHSLTKSAKYKRIVDRLKRNVMKAELCFVSCSAEVFTSFTGLFQRQEPLVHVLYDELRKVALTLAGRVCKPAVIGESEFKSDVLFKIENLLSISKVEVCSQTTASLRSVTEREKIAFLGGAQKHYIAACKHLLNKTPIGSDSLVKHFRCLQPGERLKERSLLSISKICAALPIENISTSAIKDEWRLMRLEDVIDENVPQRIDHYWRNIISLKNCSGEVKYPLLAKVVRASLALSHGSSDVERSFSMSKRVLTEDRAQMSQRTLNARMIVLDAMKSYENNVAKVPITKELISLGYSARSSYTEYLETEKKKKLADERMKAEEVERLRREELCRQSASNAQKAIEHMEKKTKDVRKEKEMKQQSSDGLLKEANSRLKKAIEKNDLQGVRLAQGLLEGANVLLAQERVKDKELAKLEIGLHKRKSSLISEFFSKKSKKGN